MNSKTKCLITAAGIFFGIMAAVHAKDNDEDSILCSARGLTGTYLFHASGFNISVTGVPQPKAIVEVFRFDGDGKFVSATDMDPCLGRDDCPLYPAARPYRYALEVRRGGLAGLGIGPGSWLTTKGACP